MKIDPKKYEGHTPGPWTVYARPEDKIKHLGVSPKDPLVSDICATITPHECSDRSLNESIANNNLLGDAERW